MQEDRSAETAEAVDDPSWVNPGQEDKSDDDDDTTEDDTFSDPDTPAKKKRVRNKNNPAKLTKCPHCFREFTNLKHHINQQHSQLKNYKCAACGYSCYLKTDLERHITNVHQKQRRACPVCGKRYSDLRQHIRLVHEGRKHECPTCKKKFTNLSQHINKTHKRLRAAQCDKCGKTFYLESQLRRHQEDVHSY